MSLWTQAWHARPELCELGQNSSRPFVSHLPLLSQKELEGYFTIPSPFLEDFKSSKVQENLWVGELPRTKGKTMKKILQRTILKGKDAGYHGSMVIEFTFS